jgi:hypothetical protein
MGRKRKRELHPGALEVLNMPWGKPQPRPELTGDKAKKFLSRIADRFREMAYLTPTEADRRGVKEAIDLIASSFPEEKADLLDRYKFEPISAYESAAEFVYHAIEFDLGRDEARRIFARLGKPWRKNDEMRQRRKILPAIGGTDLIAEWMLANPELAKWYGIRSKNHDSIVRELKRWRAKLKPDPLDGQG